MTGDDDVVMADKVDEVKPLATAKMTPSASSWSLDAWKPLIVESASSSSSTSSLNGKRMEPDTETSPIKSSMKRPKLFEGDDDEYGDPHVENMDIYRGDNDDVESVNASALDKKDDDVESVATESDLISNADYQDLDP
ncbi:hypothetical protein HDU76_009637, partial [Blyttiomyces sp. JEL0837]